MQETYLHNVEKIPLQKIIKDEYRMYQIYTLMDRAIPYLADGLKPSQRRILYTLYKHQSKGLTKVSSVTGLVLTLHPHGPASVESAIVNMAQDYTFSNNYPLIDKKGYFGERMETTPAASRYIECKLGKVAEIILFDDLNQVEMVPNYDEKVMEPVHLLPKLPIMLLNGAEGIGTGFSSVVPAFNHKDIVDSMIKCVQTGKPKKIRPWSRYYSEDIELDDGKLVFRLRIEEIDGKFYITELPRGYDAQRIYRYLGKFVDDGFLKDYIDSSVDNDILIQLIFKKGTDVDLEEIQKKMNLKTTQSPNYTLISERGVKIYDRPEEIIGLFTEQRINVVRKRYELLSSDYEKKITQHSEIIRFIKEKHYAKAEKMANRKSFVEYLSKAKFTFSEYLADMPIYRMTKEEVAKRQDMLKNDSQQLKICKRIAKSPALVKEKLIEELLEVKDKLNDLMDKREKEKKNLRKDLGKAQKKRAKKKSDPLDIKTKRSKTKKRDSDDEPPSKVSKKVVKKKTAKKSASKKKAVTKKTAKKAKTTKKVVKKPANKGKKAKKKKAKKK